MAGKSRSKKKSSNEKIIIGINDVPEIQCIVCKGEDCELFIELKLHGCMFVGVHSKCYAGEV